MIEMLLAQVVPVPVPMNDWIVGVIIAVTPIIVAVLKWIVTNFKAKLPSWLVPLIAMALGALAAYLGGLTVANPMLAAVIGMAVIGLREIVVELGRALGIFPAKV